MGCWDERKKEKSLGWEVERRRTILVLEKTLKHQQDIVSRDGQMYRKKEMETKGDMLHCGK